jgi:hypothetical protein
MNTVTVGWLKARLMKYVQELDGYEDTRKVNLHHNTCWVHDDYLHLLNMGFVRLDEIDFAADDDEDEDEDDDT